QAFVGDFGKSRIWSSPAESTYDAYMYRNAEGKIIGVVRIPNYTPELGGDQAAADFSEIIQHFETHTDAMIIDQLNNPGGSLFLVYTLASMLTEQSLFLPKNRVALTPSTVAQCAQILKMSDFVINDATARMLYGPSIEGYPITYNFHLMTKNHCEFVISEYKQQKQISDPTWIWGFDKINPYPGPRYTKSIVVMVNELDFSGGDWFPSILQDNKIATIVGVRTAGAGGYISQMSFPSSFGLNRIVFTGSLAERVDTSTIENLGIKPDINIPMTALDYFSGFSYYKSKVRQVLNSLLK
ncbi:MAG: protease-like activity factor CPAF, partial [Bdellovibrio sp.]